MFKKNNFFVLFLFLFNSTLALAAGPSHIFEEAFATAIVLSDSESISLGIGNFNPDTLLKPTHQHLTEGDSITLRNELKVYALPYTFVVNSENKQWSDKVMLRLAYIRQDSSHDLFAGTNLQPDHNIDKVYSFYSAYSNYQPLAENWKLRLRLGSYLMHYENNHQYNNPLSTAFKPALEGIYFNTMANAAIIEPNVKLSYTRPKNWGKWQFSTDINYFIGKVYSGSASSRGASPEGWRINNGVKIHFDVNKANLHTESIYLKFERIDMHGDMVASFQTDHFYEAGIGVLLDIHKYTSLADNIGIGININKGSDISGGSIVFYINEF